MIIVACVEDRNGILFNKRRVSRDIVVCQDVLNTCPTRLWMNSYSAPLFADLPQRKIQVAEDFLRQAEAGQWCFVENVALPETSDEIEQVILYRWNQKYPADTYFDVDLADWQLLSATELAGHSHGKISKEVYGRR